MFNKIKNWLTSGSSEKAVTQFVDPINPDDFENECVVIANDLSNYPQEYQKGVFTLRSWLVNEGDYVKKGQRLFELQIERKNYAKVEASGNSPIDGILIKRGEENIVLRANQNCCVIKPLSDSELKELLYQIDYIEREVESPRMGHMQIPFNEVSINEHKASSTINVYEDEFSGEIRFESKVIRSTSFKGSINIKLSFLKNKKGLFLTLRAYRKNCKLKKGSKIHFLFSDGSKFTFESDKDGVRVDKDSDGVIFENHIEINMELLYKFSVQPLEKWKIESEQENLEIIGGKGFEYWGSDYPKREIILIAKTFKYIIEREGNFD